MRLKNWYVTGGYDSEFIAPEFRKYHLQGNVYGHPNFKDGDPVTTSRIMEISDKGSYKEVITRSGSVYELYKEDVDKDVERYFPDYYERFGFKTVGKKLLNFD